MKNLTPYEKELAQQLNDLPLPDENAAWKDMKAMLDDDDDHGAGILPPPTGNNKKGWALLFVFLLLFLSFFFFYTEKPAGSAEIHNQNAATDPGIKNTPENKVKSGTQKSTATLQEQTPGKVKDGINQQKDKGEATVNTQPENAEESINANNKLPGNTPGKQKEQPQEKITNKNDIVEVQPGTGTKVKQRQGGSIKKNNDKNNAAGENVGTTSTNGTDNAGKRKPSKKRDSSLLVPGVTVVGQPKVKTNSNQFNSEIDKQSVGIDDTKKIKPADNEIDKLSENSNSQVSINELNRKDTVLSKPENSKVKDSAVTAKKNPGKKKSVFAAGIAVQQSIRLDCHCSYPNNNMTSTTEVTDYFPSVYARFYPVNKKWFLQAEFKYAAPFYVEEFLYKQNVQSQPLNYISTSYILKKVYYHQVPVSFNYFIVPNWSTGAGLAYNIFSGAVSQKEVTKKLYGTANDSLINSVLIKDKNDSNFVTMQNHLQGFLETQYQWKHFSFGARYAFGLMPYVKYIDPLLKQPAEKKINSLNIFIRYELWNNKKK